MAEKISQEVLATYITAALALQFAAFGWRVAREVAIGESNRKTWFPVIDLLIIASMCATVAICIVLPLLGKVDSGLAVLMLAIAYVVIAAYPINTAAHYRLFSSGGRAKYKREGHDYPYITDQEWLTLVLTFVAIGLTVFNFSP